jgi:hypothetical protein
MSTRIKLTTVDGKAGSVRVAPKTQAFIIENNRLAPSMQVMPCMMSWRCKRDGVEPGEADALMGDFAVLARGLRRRLIMGQPPVR